LRAFAAYLARTVERFDTGDTQAMLEVTQVIEAEIGVCASKR